MLKINKVYIRENKEYLFVHSKIKKNGRNEYTVSKVNHYGELGRRKKVYFKRGKYRLFKDADIKIYVNIPQKDKQRMRWQLLVNDGIRKMTAIKISHDRDIKSDLRKEIGKLAVASIYFQNNETGERFNLRDFAKGLGFKNYATLYRWVEQYLNSIYTPQRYKKAIKEAADRTIVQSYNNTIIYWDGMYGYNKKINKILERDFKAYSKELKNRNLST